MVIPTVDESAEDSISNLSPELRCTGFDAMGEWCRQNREMCFKRIGECHELMDGEGKAIGICKTYLAFAIILRKLAGFNEFEIHGPSLASGLGLCEIDRV